MYFKKNRLIVENDNGLKNAYFEGRAFKKYQNVDMNFFWRSLLIANVCNPHLKFNALWSQNNINFGLNFEKTTTAQKNMNFSLGYEFSNNLEFALQQKFDINRKQFGKSEFGIKHSKSGNDYKAKLGCDGVLGLSSKFNLRSGLDLEVSAESTIFGEKKTVGLYQAPFNFGVMISHRN